MDHFDQKLFSAVVSRDVEDVKRLLGPIDVRSHALQPALSKCFVESAGRDASILHWFLEVGFDINATDEEHDTALMVAARGEDRTTVHITDEKLSKDTINDGYPSTSVECIKSLRELLDRKASLNLANKDGRTALIQCVQNSGNVEIVELLLEKKCDVLAKLHSALHYAAGRGQTKNVNLLLTAKCDVMAKTIDGDSVLHKACYAGKIEVVRAILQYNVDINCENDENQTPLMMAAQAGSLEIVSELLSRGADVTKRDHIGMTALQYAVTNAAGLSVVESLVEARSDVQNSCTDEYSAETVLIHAVISSSVKVVEYLLARGAMINAANKDGQTPLIIAAMYKRHDMLQLLLMSGASVEAVDKDGCTALMKSVIIMDKKAAELLLQSGASIHSQNENGFTAMSLAMYKDTNFGKDLYARFRKLAELEKSTTNPTVVKQRTSSTMEPIRMGDFVYLSLDENMALGCNGFISKHLQPTPVDSEWEEHVFRIHPKLAYDHVDMSVVEHPYFQISDQYAESERYI
ncbi:Aste57867_8377 [Aphanomyces stellatus]|uniref:Aste57867_8377 protein n=1 Tax=Aphanomyces stellatus TaxID=120398 RepID=A0A485KK35_9STRA|nr:hypothetical protein As57867_008345 [Aphanomyces stellatus]VFT85263.1 Aste57867_8377 [Aphanomyces stellatus]